MKPADTQYTPHDSCQPTAVTPGPPPPTSTPRSHHNAPRPSLAHVLYLLWKSLRMVSLMNRLVALGSPRVWFLRRWTTVATMGDVLSVVPGHCQ